MNARVHPHPIAGEITAVASKSYAHRMLIAAALSGSGLSYGESEDAFLTAHALSSLGFEATFSENAVRYGAFHKPDREVCVDVGESGSTLRFLIPLAAALGVKVRFLTRGRLGERPMGALTNTLSEHGVQASAAGVSGQLTAGVYEIDATVSSQFVTGLLLALPLLGGDSEIRLLGRAVSAPYIEITLKVLQEAGIQIKRREKGFLIKGAQRYQLTDRAVPGDYSGAAFFLVAGALGNGVNVKGLDKDDVQGDKAVLDALRQAGAEVCVLDNGVTVSKGALHAFSANVGETPDIAPILSVLAAFCEGTSVLSKVSRLRDKESDRLFAIQDMLSKAGIFAEVKEDALLITGGKPQGAAFDSFSDHRMAMSEAILAAFACGESKINDMTCVKKSYPRFWENFACLGGKYEVEGR